MQTQPSGEDLHHHVRDLLTAQGQRYTAARERLVDVLVSAGRPVTLPEIVADDADLAASSAYRNLDVLEQCGAIRRIAGGGDHTHFELAERLLGHHHHLICVECGAIEDIHLDDDLEAHVEVSLTQAARSAGYTPLYHSLDLHGRCETCEASATESGS